MTSPDQYVRSRPGSGTPLSQLVRDHGAIYAPGAGVNAEDPLISGIVIDNRAARPGDIFAALSGEVRHGIQFAAAAVSGGAVAVWTDPAGAEFLESESNHLPSDIPVVVSPDPRALVGPIAAQILGHPSRGLHLVGVTGSNGKTTTSFLVSAALAAHFGEIALRGTVGTVLGSEQIASQRTTAEAPELQEFFAEMMRRGISAGVLEVSSHAVSLHRITGTEFSVVGFTNLQRDHLDFHGDMESYFQAKLALLDPSYTKSAVVNVDDEWGQRAAVEASAPVETLSTRGAQADWQVRDIAPLVTPTGDIAVGSRFTLTGPDGAVDAAINMSGDFNIANAAMAIILSYRAGVPLTVAARAIAEYPGVPGRMETVSQRGPGPLAIVDYAHAPDSIAAAIAAARPLTPGRLIVVIASDGGRDEGKRPLMGAVAAAGADVVIVSDDNPRFEDPAKIRREIILGARDVGGAQIIEAETRFEAVEICARMATAADTILLTGKGHETTQEIRGEMHYHDDREQIRQLLARKWS